MSKIDFKSYFINEKTTQEQKPYLLKLWQGSGYLTSTPCCWATSEEEAIDKVFSYCAEKEYWNIIFDYPKAVDFVSIGYETELKELNETEGADAVLNRVAELIDSELVSDSNYEFFARQENFAIVEIPENEIK